MTKIFSTATYLRGGEKKQKQKQVAILSFADSDFLNKTATYDYTAIYDVENFDKCYIENQDSEYPTIAYIVNGNLYSLQNTSHNTFNPSGTPHLIDDSGECISVGNGTFEGIVPSSYDSGCRRTPYIHSDGRLWFYYNYPRKSGQVTYKGQVDSNNTLSRYKFYKVCGRHKYDSYAPRYPLALVDCFDSTNYPRSVAYISDGGFDNYLSVYHKESSYTNVKDICGRYSDSGAYYCMYIMLTSDNKVRLGQKNGYWFDATTNIKYISCRSGGYDSFGTSCGGFGLIDLNDYWVVGYMSSTSSSSIKTIKTNLQVKEITSGYFAQNYAIGLDGHLYYVEGRTSSEWNNSPSPKMIDDGQWTSIACNRRNYGALGIKNGMLYSLYGGVATPLPKFGKNNIKVQGVQNFMLFKE